MNSLIFSDLTQRLSGSFDISYPDANNNNGEKSKVTTKMRGDKYSLRPRSMRREEEEQDTTISKKQSRLVKTKQKPAPLSKYRRKTANARERTRMREINAAFEALRRCVPSVPESSAVTNEKLTKITTLRLAMKYITALNAVLHEAPSSTSVNSNSTSLYLRDLFSDCSDLDCLLLESDGESLPLSDQSLTSSDFVSELTTDFTENSLSPTFPEQSLSSFEPFFSDFT